MFGFTRIIKIPGKSTFDELDAREFAVLIESFLSGGNASFDEIALNEFLHAKVKQPLACALQARLVANAFLPSQHDEWPTINVSYLTNLVSELRSGIFSA